MLDGLGLSHVLNPMSHAGATMRQLETPVSTTQESNKQLLPYLREGIRLIISCIIHRFCVCQGWWCDKTLPIRYPGGRGVVYRIEINNRALKFFEKNN